MKKVIKIILLIVMFFMLNGCSAMYVNNTVGVGVKPHVKKEMVKNERRRRIEKRKIDKAHSKRRRKVNKLQRNPNL